MIRYEEIKHAIAALESEADALKPVIIQAIPPNTEVEGTDGIFTVQQRASWKFSKALEEDKKILKDREAEEKAKGIAKATYDSVLYYKRAAE